MTTAFSVNGKAVQSAAPAHTPLLWVIREELVEHMSTNLCRCGTYPRIVRAIERAAREG